MGARPAHGRTAATVAVLATLAVAAVAGAGAGGETTATEAAAVSPGKPNIVVVMADDQTLSTFRRSVMPRTTRLLVDGGTRFSDYVVSTPLCCPSRAVYLTGQYAHNNGVFSNDPGYSDLLDKQSTLPTWLHGAGYRTAHVGKFLHGYDGVSAAPGFDEWHAMLRPFDYFGFELSANGRRVSYGERDYLTTTLTKKAVGLVDRFAARSQPLFLSVAYWAPHGGGPSPGSCSRAPQPAPRDDQRFSEAPLPRPPSFNERDVSDKPSFIRELPRLSPGEVRALEQRYRCTLASLQEVDRGVERLYEAFDALGEAENTVFIFTSDNGYFFGEHRLSGKSLAYEEAIRQPLAMRLPADLAAADGQRIVAPVANVDLAPTILDLADATPCTSQGACRTLDGRSLLPLAAGEAGWPADRAILLESRRNTFDGQTCRYTALRRSEQLYVEHDSVLDPRTNECKVSKRNGVVERYDLSADPFELENLHSSSPGSEDRRIERELSDRLGALSSCAGIAGRDPRPESGAYCD